MALFDVSESRSDAMLSIKLMLPLLIIGAGVALLALPVVAHADAATVEKARRFIATHEARVRPLEVAAARAW
jgi:hypothetical protein